MRSGCKLAPRKAATPKAGKREEGTIYRAPTGRKLAGAQCSGGGKRRWRKPGGGGKWRGRKTWEGAWRIRGGRDWCTGRRGKVRGDLPFGSGYTSGSQRAARVHPTIREPQRRARMP